MQKHSREEVGVQHIPVSERKRSSNQLNPSLQGYLEWLSITNPARMNSNDFVFLELINRFEFEFRRCGSSRLWWWEVVTNDFWRQFKENDWISLGYDCKERKGFIPGGKEKDKFRQAVFLTHVLKENTSTRPTAMILFFQLVTKLDMVEFVSGLRVGRRGSSTIGKTISVNRTPTHTACTDAHSMSAHTLHSMITFHHANTRGSRVQRLRIARTGVLKRFRLPRVMSRSLPHLTLTTSTSSLSPISCTSPIFPTVSLLYTSPMILDPWIPPAMFHGRVADKHKSHVSQVMSPSRLRIKPSTPWQSSLKTSSPEELSLTGILGQIRIKDRKDVWESHLLKKWSNLEKLVQRFPISSHRCIPIMTHRRALQTRILKMENYEESWLHHCMCKIEKTVNLLERQSHRWNLLHCFH